MLSLLLCADLQRPPVPVVEEEQYYSGVDTEVDAGDDTDPPTSCVKGGEKKKKINKSDNWWPEYDLDGYTHTHINAPKHTHICS